MESPSSLNFLETLAAFRKKTVVTMLFLGFSAGLPILLIFSSLSLWLREAGVTRSAVTFFSWAALGYSFKFIWAPLPDQLPLPFLTKILGRRRSWLLFSQVGIIAAIMLMAFTDPSNSESALRMMAIGAVMLGFSSATQDIVIDAYRIESDSMSMQGLLSSTYIAGYRVAMIFAGAGALYLASAFGTTMAAYNYDAWKWTYLIMAASMLVGVITTLVIPEPPLKKLDYEYSSSQYGKFFLLFLICIGVFLATFSLILPVTDYLKNHPMLEGFGEVAGFFADFLRFIIATLAAAATAFLLVALRVVNRKMVAYTYIAPVRDFFSRYGHTTALLLLALVGLYRISDIVLGVISNVFYQDLGFSKNEIASVVKTFGLIMTLVGGFLGGLLATRINIIKILFLGAVLSAVTNVFFILLAQKGASLWMLYLVISADNLSAGVASAAFVAFLSSLTNVSFTAVQYAIFSSLMTLFPKLLGGYSGTMVSSLGYPAFFAATALMGIPVLFIIWLVGKKLKIKPL